MSPEQGRGKPVAVRCDLFSLGVVLYRITTGRLAFETSDTVSMLIAVASDKPQSPRALHADPPADISDYNSAGDRIQEKL
jgi:eukaryotic-like serine/threonine-protein kinase